MIILKSPQDRQGLTPAEPFWAMSSRCDEIRKPRPKKHDQFKQQQHLKTKREEKSERCLRNRAFAILKKRIIHLEIGNGETPRSDPMVYTLESGNRAVELKHYLWKLVSRRLNEMRILEEFKAFQSAPSPVIAKTIINLKIKKNRHIFKEHLSALAAEILHKLFDIEPNESYKCFDKM